MKELFDRARSMPRSALIEGCAAYISAKTGVNASVMTPAYRSDAAVLLKKPGKWDISGIECDTEDTPFRRIFLQDGCICFDCTDGFLAALCASAGELPVPKTAKLIAIPREGCAADEEACAYAVSLLLARYRSGKPFRESRLGRDALLKCLFLREDESVSALAAAVRAVLAACACGDMGGEYALICAKLLAQADPKA